MNIPRLAYLAALAPIFSLPFFVVSCHTPAHEENLELHIYDAPKGTSGMLAGVLRDITWMGENNKLAGRATVTPDGKLAVLATPGIQKGVEALVDEVAKNPPPSVADPTIALDYFFVVGKPSAKPEPYPAGVDEIKAGLDEIVRAQGPQTFTVAERATLTSQNDTDGKLYNDIEGDKKSQKLEVQQKATRTSEGVFASVSLRWNENKLDTRVQLGGDKIVVLGATGANASDPTDGSTLYYLVRVSPRADGKRP